MFEYPQQPTAKEPCKPDPEVMLKNTSYQLSMLRRAEEILREIVALPLYIHEQEIERAFLLLFGSIRLRVYEAERERDMWLAEINNEANS